MSTASGEFTSPAFLTFSCEIKPVKPNRLKTGQKEKKKTTKPDPVTGLTESSKIPV